MNLKQLIDVTSEELVKRMRASTALAVFARRRAKFEGWLKVELIDILLKNGVDDAVPEQGLIDVSFRDVAIELKTVNTNYRDGIADLKARTITENIKSVIKDIGKHRRNEFPHKFIIFVVFPLNESHVGWKTHLDRIEKELGDACSGLYFRFKKAGLNNQSVSGCLYYGKVMNQDLVCKEIG